MLSQSAGAVKYTNCTSAEEGPKECPDYDTKQSDGEAPVIFELWGMPSLQDPLCPE